LSSFDVAQHDPERVEGSKGGADTETPEDAEGNSGRIAVGVFDSGVGGVSVLSEIHTLLPSVDLVYVADSKYVPYGVRPPEFVRARSSAIAEYLIEQHHVSAIVVACNTATTHAVERLRERWRGIPIVGMEPGVKPAARASKTKVVGVLATGSTLDSPRFAALIERSADGVRVLTQPCPGLVEQVEQGHLTGPATVDLLTRYTAPLLDRGADTIVLGCTHYPFLRATLQQIVGDSVTVIDTSAAVARQTGRVLRTLPRGPRPGEGASGSVTFITSGDRDRVRDVLTRLWGAPIPGVYQM
jgi:glutamate racemase